ncbi:MAG: serine/threonine-protein kinase, partial [Limisphaerales bacterium]
MNPSNRCPRCGGPRDPETLRGLCPGCLVRWTRPPLLPAGLADSIWVWDGGKGNLIKGYELGEEIGRGGAGIVYRARQLSLDRAVAVKLLLEGPFADPAQVERFRLEAKAAASLDHPAIVPIHEVGEADGRVFYSMSLVEGPTLEKVLEGFCLPAIRRDPKAAGRGLRRAVRDRQREIALFLAQIAQGVQHAHQHGVLHRDLKPGNILIAPGNRPMITDFGLVWVAGSKRGSGGSDSIHGTPNYIAPELTREPERSSVACDVYALGAIGYELVTGEPPFEAGNPVETLIRIREGHLTPPRDLEPALSPDFEAILLRCLNPNPSRRYSSAEALAQDLERFVAGHPVEARDPAWP